MLECKLFSGLHRCWWRELTIINLQHNVVTNITVAIFNKHAQLLMYFGLENFSSNFRNRWELNRESQIGFFLFAIARSLFQTGYQQATIEKKIQFIQSSTPILDIGFYYEKSDDKVRFGDFWWWNGPFFYFCESLILNEFKILKNCLNFGL